MTIEKINVIKNYLLSFDHNDDWMRIANAISSTENISLNDIITASYAVFEKRHNDSKCIQFLLKIGLVSGEEEFLIKAKSILLKNEYALNESFESYISSLFEDSPILTDKDAILAFGEFLESTYAMGYYFTGGYIRELYSKLSCRYANPLIEKVLKNCGKVYSWNNEEAIEIYEILNYYTEEARYKGTNHEKSSVAYYMGLFINECKNRGVDSISNLTYSSFELFQLSAKLGCKNAEIFIENNYDGLSFCDDYGDYNSYDGYDNYGIYENFIEDSLV